MIKLNNYVIIKNQNKLGLIRRYLALHFVSMAITKIWEITPKKKTQELLVSSFLVAIYS